MGMKENKSVKIADAAKPFYHEGSDRAVLFIHAFTESLYRVNKFAKDVNDKLGYTTYGIRLSGHGTSPEDLINYDTSHWRADCDKAIKELIKKNKKEIDVIGLSLGGLLALELAAKYPEHVKRVICVDTPIRLRLHGGVKLLTKTLKPFLKYWRKRTYKRLTQEQLKDLLDNGFYDRIPGKCIDDIIRFMEKELSFLSKVHSDILLIQGKSSVLLDVSSAERIMSKVASKKKKVVYIDNYYHSLIIPTDFIFEKTLNFLQGIE